MELFNGRPADCSGRQEREVRVYDRLDRLGIAYQRTDHADMPAMTMEDCNKIDAVLGVLICKNLFLCNRQKTSYYLLLMPGDKPFRTKELSAQLGVARLSFADEAALLDMLDLQPGAVSVMGLMNDTERRVRLIIDADVLAQPDFGCHPCVNTSSLKMRTEDMVNVFLPSTGHDYTVVNLGQITE